MNADDRPLARAYARGTPLPVRARAGVVELTEYRHLVWYMAKNSLWTEARESWFGVLWWAVDPMLLMAVYTILVELILKRGVRHYPLFVLAGILIWEFFGQAALRSMAATLSAEQSMREVAFPRAVVPLATTLAEAIRFLIALVVLAAVAVPFGVIPSASVALVIPFLVLEFMFAIGASLFLSALNVFFRDTRHLCDYLFWLWFHLSPGIYVIAMVPQRYRTVFELNPFTAFLDGIRTPLIYGRMPEISTARIIETVVLSITVLVGGFLYFVSAERSFAKVI